MVGVGDMVYILSGVEYSIINILWELFWFFVVYCLFGLEVEICVDDDVMVFLFGEFLGN